MSGEEIREQASGDEEGRSFASLEEALESYEPSLWDRAGFLWSAFFERVVRATGLKIKRWLARLLFRSWPYDAGILVIDSASPGYWDAGDLVPRAVFDLFMRFARYDHNFQYYLEKRSKGEKLAEFSSPPSDPFGQMERRQHRDYMKLLALYDWWLVTYPAMVSDWEKTLAEAFEGPEEHREECHRRYWELEKQMEHDLTAKTIELVKLRLVLWT